MLFVYKEGLICRGVPRSLPASVNLVQAVIDRGFMSLLQPEARDPITPL